MKKLFISLCMLCAGTVSFADGLGEIGDPSVGGVIIITECGIAVQVPNVNYSPSDIEELIDYLTELHCNQSADGPLP